MKQDRFLTGILIGIAVLIGLALIVFFTRKDTQTYVAEDTPEGVVRNYVLAVMKKDYQKAYGYLADLEHKPTFDDFHRAFSTGMLSPSNAGVKVGGSEVTGEDATVEIGMIFSPRDPFSTEYSNMGLAQLVRQDGAWKISSMPAYNFWDYSWYQAPPK